MFDLSLTEICIHGGASGNMILEYIHGSYFC